ncbi:MULTISPECIES: TetR family transcriptional regulator [unclassified Luteococcus]|uniref:TetR family transcriptional regulator n=1 Tax=unclassified Luteococcus TaxID=2639923 RepID=UPI00313BFC88
MSLARDEVIAAAVGILDEYGLADLSMRRLADALGVKAGALYWHVANKQTLLAAVADRVLAELPTPQPDAEPRAALVAWAHDLRRVLLGHRDSADLVATALASGLCERDPLTGIVVLLARRESGDTAAWGARALLHLVLGHVAEEQNIALFAQLGKLDAPTVDQDAAFAHAVGALVDGLLPSAA